MSKLYISQKYYDKFLEQEARQMIIVYGFPNRDDYFNAIIKFLNELYSFLEIFISCEVILLKGVFL